MSNLFLGDFLLYLRTNGIDVVGVSARIPESDAGPDNVKIDTVGEYDPSLLDSLSKAFDWSQEGYDARVQKQEALEFSKQLDDMVGINSLIATFVQVLVEENKRQNERLTKAIDIIHKGVRDVDLTEVLAFDPLEPETFLAAISAKLKE